MYISLYIKKVSKSNFLNKKAQSAYEISQTKKKLFPYAILQKSLSDWDWLEVKWERFQISFAKGLTNHLGNYYYDFTTVLAS